MTGGALDLPGWRTLAHVGAGDALPGDWRDRLARRLGQRPRRVGLWTELAMYGARCCLDAAGEAALPAGARLRVSSLRGPLGALHAGLAQLDAGMVMPSTYIPRPPALRLGEGGRGLGWQGVAGFARGRAAERLPRLALQGAGAAGLLFGIVEEARDGEAARSEWWRLVPA